MFVLENQFWGYKLQVHISCKAVTILNCVKNMLAAFLHYTPVDELIEKSAKTSSSCA